MLEEGRTRRNQDQRIAFCPSTCDIYWRMLFYLSLIDQSEVNSFLDWSVAYLTGQRDEFRQRFTPVMQGLTVVAGGDHFDPEGYHLPSGGRRFLRLVRRPALAPCTEHVRQAGSNVDR
jgi:hypothetical protein